MNYIRKNGFVGIDKSEVEKNIQAKKFIGINKNPRDEHIIISLTSFPKRISSVKYTIYSLLNQSFSADMVILWLAHEEFPNREKDLPKDLVNMTKYGLKIKWCDNILAYKKLIPAFEEYPDSVIVTADDDIYYPSEWLKILYDEHINFPNCIIAHRFHRVRMDAHGNIFPYHEWAQISLFCNNNTPPVYGNAATFGGGALCKKKFFHEDIMNRKLFTELSPHNDDIWFWTMAVLNNTKIKIPENAMSDLIFVDIDNQFFGETLWSINGRGRSAVQLQQVFSKYPEVHNKLIREIATLKPYLSIILIVKDPSKILEYIKNLMFNYFSDLEVIIINIGVRVNLDKIPYNFKLIDLPGASMGEARNIGLSKSSGIFVIFNEDNNFFVQGALAGIARIASKFNSDVIHCSAHLKSVENKINYVADDGIVGENNNLSFAPQNKQIRAINWLQGKLSRRLNTKIFKRDFLVENNFKFDDNDDSEFIFSCLMTAEKYLLTSQAFLIEGDEIVQ